MTCAVTQNQIFRLTNTLLKQYRTKPTNEQRFAALLEAKALVTRKRKLQLLLAA